MRYPGFWTNLNWRFWRSALPSLIDGPEAHSIDSIANLGLWAISEELRPDIRDSPASEEPGQGRRSSPAKRTLDAVRSLPYSGESGKALHRSRVAAGEER